MPGWGASGTLSEGQIELMARFLLNEPPAPAPISMDQIRDSWVVQVPVDERPAEPEHDLNWEDFFGVILRDMGQVAIVDGVPHELVTLADTGRATHAPTSSALP